jgi:hypothetical protein
MPTVFEDKTEASKASSKSKTTLQRRAMEMRMDGLTFEEIGGKMAISTATAIGLFIDELRRLPDLLEEEVRTMRLLELNRLDALQFSIWYSAMGGNAEAIDLVLQIMDHRAKLTKIYIN